MDDESGAGRAGVEAPASKPRTRTGDRERWSSYADAGPEEENEMMDLVSGAEVPEAEIEVSHEAIDAGVGAYLAAEKTPGCTITSCVAALYRAMRRVELSRKEPTI
jgi:hypothetical protein